MQFLDRRDFSGARLACEADTADVLSPLNPNARYFNFELSRKKEPRKRHDSTEKRVRAVLIDRPREALQNRPRARARKWGWIDRSIGVLRLVRIAPARAGLNVLSGRTPKNGLPRAKALG